MKLLLALVGLTVIGSALYQAVKCKHRWIMQHRPERETRPLLMIWICFDCGKKLAELDQTPVIKPRANVTDMSTRRQLLKQAVGMERRRA